jgi:hypothetical protein
MTGEVGKHYQLQHAQCINSGSRSVNRGRWTREKYVRGRSGRADETNFTGKISKIGSLVIQIMQEIREIEHSIEDLLPRRNNVLLG